MRRALGTLVTVAGLATAGLLVPAPSTAAGSRAPGAKATFTCPPSARALGYSDALDKLTRGGATLGGLSNIAWDATSRSWASTVDNHDTDPARIWFYRDLPDPSVTRAPLVLRKPSGTPYTGLDADDEGLAVLPGGRFAVSSENEPVIRIFGRDGIRRATITVPHRFLVAPNGEAGDNATLEGLTVTPGGNRLVASMEGALSGDGGADSTYRRFLVYDRHHHRGRTRFTLTKQVGYQVQPGNRVAEVQAYGRGRLLVLEAAFDPSTGNSIELYAVRRLGSAKDVSDVADLSAKPSRVMRKRLVADVTSCPTLGATSEEPQVNPLMDNYEGMAVQQPATGRSGLSRVTLISDDNFSATQRTRVLRLAARLP